MHALVMLALVASGEACPRAQKVFERLEALRGPAPQPYALEVRTDAAGVTFAAVTSAGAPWLEHRLPPAPCDELEHAAAAVLLAWEARLDPLNLEPRARWGASVQAAGQVWLSSVAPVWGATAGVRLAPANSPHGLSVGLFAQGSRVASLGTGEATWSRVSAFVGPSSHRDLGAWRLGLAGGVTGGVLFLAGRGFEASRTLTDWDVGLLASVRVVGPERWHLRPVLELSGLLWLRRHIVTSDGPTPAQVPLPALEFAPTLGLEWTP